MMAVPFLRMPRTITGQFTLIVGACLLLANFLTVGAMYFLLWSNGSQTTPTTATRSAVVAELADQIGSKAQADHVLALGQAIGLPVTRTDGVGKLPPAGAVQSFLRSRALKRFVETTGINDKRRRVEIGDRHTAIVHLSGGGAVSMPLPDGGEFAVSRMIIAPVIYILTVVTIALIGFSFYVTRFVTAPLSSLAEAADRMGRATNAAVSLPETGPREILKVSRAFNDMRSRINVLLDERSGMLMAISHDLRTPLTRIRLRAERFVGASPLIAMRDGILEDISRMEEMLSETLVFMRESGRMEDTMRVDLSGLVQTICVERADLGSAVSYEGPEAVVYACQPASLTRAITNLVENGLKYGDKVDVTLSIGANRAIQIDVRDDGPGIDERFHQKVFEPFFKINSARTTAGDQGFGLGLSIARSIALAHDGNIEVMKMRGPGAHIRMSLPPQPFNSL